jgi:hypothetical protein
MKNRPVSLRHIMLASVGIAAIIFSVTLATHIWPDKVQASNICPKTNTTLTYTEMAFTAFAKVYKTRAELFSGIHVKYYPLYYSPEQIRDVPIEAEFTLTLQDVADYLGTAEGKKCCEMIPAPSLSGPMEEVFNLAANTWENDHNVYLAEKRVVHSYLKFDSKLVKWHQNGDVILTPRRMASPVNNCMPRPVNGNYLVVDGPADGYAFGRMMYNAVNRRYEPTFEYLQKNDHAVPADKDPYANIKEVQLLPGNADLKIAKQLVDQMEFKK